MRQLIIEDWSTDTAEQSLQISKIVKEKGFEKIYAVVDTWHGPRFYSTLLEKNPELTIYTQYVHRDENNINSAAYDFDQRDFQTPLLISEIARFHKYAAQKIGPVSPDILLEYLGKKYEEKLLPKSINDQKAQRLLYLWNKNHKEILKNFTILSSYR